MNEWALFNNTYQLLITQNFRRSGRGVGLNHHQLSVSTPLSQNIKHFIFIFIRLSKKTEEYKEK